MKNFLSLMAAASLVAAIAGPALATDDDENVIERGADATGSAIKHGAEATGEAVKSGAEATGEAVKSGAEAAGHAVKSGAEATGHAIKSGAETTGAMLGISDTERERFEANQRGERRVIGTVTAIDRETGKINLAASDGTIYQLHFPSGALENVTQGERLAVTMAFALPDQPLATGEKNNNEVQAAAGDQPLKSDHWMTGTVTDVDSGKGTIGVKTDAALLTLHFKPDEVRNIKTGEKIAVELAFEPAAGNPQRN